MNEIQIFKHDSFGQVRVINEDNPLFCATDVATILGYSNPAAAVQRHCKGITKRDTLTSGGVQDLLYIPESDVYRLVMRSKLPEAEGFQDWVCEVVLPSIRKTSGYIHASESDTPETIMAKAVLIAQETIKEQERKILKQQQQIKEAASKVLFADAVATSPQSCLVRELAKLLCQRGVDIGEKRLYEYLRGNGYLIASGAHRNEPYQRYVEMGLFETIEWPVYKAETIDIKKTTKVTGKGQIYFINKFLKQS
jgi:anti-repressor protein